MLDSGENFSNQIRFFFMCGYIIGQFSDLCIFVHGVTLWSSTQHFGMVHLGLIYNPTPNWNEIFIKCEDLKMLTIYINMLLATLVVFFMGTCDILAQQGTISDIYQAT